MANEAPKLTPDEYADLIRLTKPHIIKLEDEIDKVQYGEITVKLTVRAGVIEKMIFHEERTWLKEKDKN